MDTQVSISLANGRATLFTAGLPHRSSDLPEFSRCEVRRRDGTLSVISYNKREEVGDNAYIGPYQVLAEFRSRNDTIQFFGSSETRTGFEQLRAAAHTLRIDVPSGARRGKKLEDQVRSCIRHVAIRQGV